MSPPQPGGAGTPAVLGAARGAVWGAQGSHGLPSRSEPSPVPVSRLRERTRLSANHSAFESPACPPTRFGIRLRPERKPISEGVIPPQPIGIRFLPPSRQPIKRCCKHPLPAAGLSPNQSQRWLSWPISAALFPAAISAAAARRRDGGGGGEAEGACVTSVVRWLAPRSGAEAAGGRGAAGGGGGRAGPGAMGERGRVSRGLGGRSPSRRVRVAGGVGPAELARCRQLGGGPAGAPGAAPRGSWVVPGRREASAASARSCCPLCGAFPGGSGRRAGAQAARGAGGSAHGSLRKTPWCFSPPWGAAGAGVAGGAAVFAACRRVRGLPGSKTLVFAADFAFGPGRDFLI